MRASKPVQVREPEPELVSAVEPLALAQAAALVQVREPEPVQAQQLAAEQLERVQVQVRELVSAVEPLEPPLVRVQGWEPARQQEPAVEPEQVRELRVSRQQEPQPHRLQVVAQELLPYRPVLPMKAPC